MRTSNDHCGSREPRWGHEEMIRATYSGSRVEICGSYSHKRRELGEPCLRPFCKDCIWNYSICMIPRIGWRVNLGWNGIFSFVLPNRQVRWEWRAIPEAYC